MKISFPAMRGTIGQREYFSCLMKLGTVPKMFTFRDWAEFAPEDREQRVLNKKRIPDIAKYILDTEDGYIFSSITASYSCEVSFKPMGDEGLGMLEMEFENANFVINDGQHRCAAIAQAIQQNPALGEESISVLLFPYENRPRVQQMFSDLNRNVAKTSRSLDILYDHRDVLSVVTREVCETLDAFVGMVEKDAISLPVRSPKLFTLASLYDANEELLSDMRAKEATHGEMVAVATNYWDEVSKVMPAWLKIKRGELGSVSFRQENISSHAVVMRAIGGLGAELFKEYPDSWVEKLKGLEKVDWRKKNREWENICIIANSVVSNRQARSATKAYLKYKLGLTLSDTEQKAIAHTLSDKSKK
jgi:DNA sulfur modification protein DndB